MLHPSRRSLVCSVTLALALGCAANNGYGESYRAALRAQTATPAKKPTGAVEGLDSQEAAIIAASYRRGLAPKGEMRSDEKVILVAPSNAGTARPQQLAPSVPAER